MGSFSELVMSFPLRRDVGADVLAAFASIAVPNPNAPSISALNRQDEFWELDGPDCDMTDPWSHDWGTWLGASYCAYMGGDQGASMLWDRDHWVVTARATWKSRPEAYVPNLAVLGTVIDADDAPDYMDPEHSAAVVTGYLVGYTRFEYDPRPWLLWACDGLLVGEDLNPPNSVEP